jgi:hypothetical protein
MAMTFAMTLQLWPKAPACLAVCFAPLPPAQPPPALAFADTVLLLVPPLLIAFTRSSCPGLPLTPSPLWSYPTQLTPHD